MMSMFELTSWLSALTRWVHVFSAILWIGQTYSFNFFEKHLESESDHPTRMGGMWMVHGGGYYRLEKHRLSRTIPQALHWFKWEAASTWLSGALLIYLSYYRGGLLVEPQMDYRIGAAAGVGTLVVGWFIYDRLALSPLARRSFFFAVLSFGFILAVHVGLSQVLSSRAAYIHVAALLGTLMAANVWLRIIPGQRRMIEAAQEERDVGSVAEWGPLRSKHNSYMVVPVIFIMISNHYPVISYGHQHSTIVLGLLLASGWALAHHLRS